MNSLKVPAAELPPDRRDKLVNGKSLQKHLENAVPAATQEVPFGLPPKLTSELQLESVSRLWKRDARKILSDCLATSTLRCPVSWVSGIPWREEKWIENYFRPLLQDSNPGWSLLDDSNGRGKIGWIPRNETFITARGQPALRLVFTDEDHRASNIQTVTFFYMKSYGPRWDSSEATVQLRHQRHGGRWQEAGSPVVLSGVHNKTTSEMYTKTISVLHSTTGGTATALQVELVHTGGSTFKLMGLAVCQ